MKTFLFIPLIALTAWCGSNFTPAELAIQHAQSEIAQHADYFDGYNHLAMAYARRAREMNDASFYARAEEAVKRSLALSPGNYEGRKTAVFIHLGKGEWHSSRSKPRES